MTSQKGIGKKLAIYVPREDQYVIDALNAAKDSRIKEGLRTSLSFELVKALKDGLVSRGVDLEKLKSAGYKKKDKS